MAALLVAGTSIGAGMLALPAITGLAGFVPAMVVNVICWLFMLATGLLFLEAVLWLEPGVNLLSTAGRFLGPWGKYLGGGAFLFLYYCLLVAYIAGGAPLFFAGLPLEELGAWKYVIFSLVFAIVVFIGAKSVNRVNWLLMWGLIGAYVLLVSYGLGKIDPALLERSSWPLALGSMPILFSAYGYHNIVPSIAMHLKRNGRSLRWAIVIGTLIPFIVYSLWQMMLIGTQDLQTIEEIAGHELPVTVALQRMANSSFVGVISGFFGFFAIVTSLLGVSLSMVDFWADGFGCKRVGVSRLLLTSLVFIPPTVFACFKPDVFISALHVAGGFGESLINGLFPVMMVWSGRYAMGLKSEWSLFGGRAMLVVLFIVTWVIIGTEVCALW